MAGGFFSVNMPHIRVFVVDVCLCPEPHLFSLGNCLSLSRVVLVGCRDDHVVQAQPIRMQRKALVCNDWPKE